MSGCADLGGPRGAALEPPSRVLLSAAHQPGWPGSVTYAPGRRASSTCALPRDSLLASPLGGSDLVEERIDGGAIGVRVPGLDDLAGLDSVDADPARCHLAVSAGPVHVYRNRDAVIAGDEDLLTLDVPGVGVGRDPLDPVLDEVVAS